MYRPALTLVPMLSAYLLRHAPEETGTPSLATRFANGVGNAYMRSLGFVYDCIGRPR